MKEISVNDRFEGVRVMLGVTKKEIKEALGVNTWTYNNISQGRKEIPHSWLNYMYVKYRVNSDWILYEKGKILC
jgi:DNA-binding XRE family transcriptional regulator